MSVFYQDKNGSVHSFNRIEYYGSLFFVAQHGFASARLFSFLRISETQKLTKVIIEKE